MLTVISHKPKVTRIIKNVNYRHQRAKYIWGSWSLWHKNRSYELSCSLKRYFRWSSVRALHSSWIILLKFTILLIFMFFIEIVNIWYDDCQKLFHWQLKLLKIKKFQILFFSNKKKQQIWSKPIINLSFQWNWISLISSKRIIKYQETLSHLDSIWYDNVFTYKN